jgi:hypothetical protein
MDANEIRARVEPIAARHLSVRLVYLFGSMARGDVHTGSFEAPTLQVLRELWAELHAALGPLSFDLVVLNDADPVLAFDVIREGKPLFYRTDDDINDFETKAWHRYQDTRHLRAIGDHYLRERAKEWSSSRNRSAND